MQEDRFEVVARGSNSDIILYDEIVLKMVDVTHAKHARHLHNQSTILKKLSHPNILTSLGFKRGVRFTDNRIGLEGVKDILLLEHASEGSLLSYLKRNKLTGKIKLELIKHCCEALYYLHIIERVAHRDIKLDNILLKKNPKGQLTALLSDFGFAIRGDPEKPDLMAHSCKGTRRGYMPPQLHVLSETPQQYEATKLDIFSLGVVIFAFFFNKLPFEFASSKDKHYSLIQSGQYKQFWLKHNIPQEAWQNVGLKEELQDLLAGMWQHLPSERFNIEEVKQSAWLNYSFK